MTNNCTRLREHEQEYYQDKHVREGDLHKIIKFKAFPLTFKEAYGPSTFCLARDSMMLWMSPKPLFVYAQDKRAIIVSARDMTQKERNK